MRIPRLPRRFCLGPGYAIQVVLLPPKALAEENDDEHESRHLRSPGAWDPETMTIYIRSALSLTEQWDVFRHELIHVVNDVNYMEAHGGALPP